MRRPAMVKNSGPYKVVSLANGQLEVTPAWPQYAPWSTEGGGGPGFMSRAALAYDLERWLNAGAASGKALA